MDDVQTIHYKGRNLRVINDDGFRVVVFHNDSEIFSTSAHYASLENAVRTAKELVDVELACGVIWRPPHRRLG
jgi:hypothetical protein